MEKKREKMSDNSKCKSSEVIEMIITKKKKRNKKHIHLIIAVINLACYSTGQCLHYRTRVTPSVPALGFKWS